MNRTTALYIRVSTDAQAEEGYSIDAQKEMLLGYCKSKRIDNYRFYIDGGYSGSNIERPEMKRLIEDIKAGKIAAVAVYKLDRLSRSQKDTLFLIEDVLNPNKTEFVSLNENLDTSTSIGRAMLGIMSAFAQLERETIKERTRMGMKKRVESGLWMGGGKIPFGFDYDKKSGKLVPNDDAQAVKKIYEMYLKGYSAAKIALATGVKYEQSVLQILKHKSNYGAIEYKGTVYENCHEPIIEKSVFLAAVEETERRKKAPTPKSNYLLSGLLVCGVCGAKIRYQKWGKYAVKLVCYSTQTSKKYLVKNPQCDLPRFDAERIEQEVMGDIFEINTDLFPQEKAEHGDILNELQRQYRQTSLSVSRLYDLYAKNGDELLVEKIDELKAQLNEISKQIADEAQNAAHKDKTKTRLGKIAKIKDIWHTVSPKDKQAFVRSIVSEVVLYHDKIEITYRL